jgi:hypothetical protein
MMESGKTHGSAEVFYRSSTANCPFHVDITLLKRSFAVDIYVPRVIDKVTTNCKVDAFDLCFVWSFRDYTVYCIKVSSGVSSTNHCRYNVDTVIKKYLTKQQNVQLSIDQQQPWR